MNWSIHPLSGMIDRAQHMIDINGLSVTYGDEHALHDVSLQVDRGSSCAIIGPSGCGKTTLLYALAGLIRPLSGHIRINGADLTAVRPATSLVLQEYGLLPWKTAFANVAFPLQAMGVGRQEREERTRNVLRDLGILEVSGRYPAELSGGERQRVAIGRALVLEPDLLLMDEAASALDDVTREHIQDLILDLYIARQMTLVVVTHSIEEAVLLGRSIAIMEKGTIRRLVDNPVFGHAQARDLPQYTETCRQVRRLLHETA